MTHIGPRTTTLFLIPVLLAGLQACTVADSSDVVTVLASWTGNEEHEFRNVLDDFTDKTGIRVNYQGTRALSQVLNSNVQRGTPPDVAILWSPAEMAKYARDGQAHPLDTVIGDQRDAYDSLWLLPQDGKIYTVPIKVNVKSLVWYNPRHTKPEPPRTWTELFELSRSVAGGGMPWCLGMGDAPSSGWPGSDMIESILLNRFGSKTYQDWSAGKLEWTSQQVKNAWTMWGDITASSRIGSGTASALLTDFEDAGWPMFADPPGCFLEHQASFIKGMYQGFKTSNGVSLRPGMDFDFFPMPGYDTATSRKLEVSADLAGMFNDTPQARRLIQFLATPEAQGIWPSDPNASAFTANKNVDPGVYKDDVSRRISDLIRNADILCFDAADVMPPAMRNAFYRAVLEYLSDPGQLDELLKRLDVVRKGAGEPLFLACGQ